MQRVSQNSWLIPRFSSFPPRVMAQEFKGCKIAREMRKWQEEGRLEIKESKRKQRATKRRGKRMCDTGKENLYLQFKLHPMWLWWNDNWPTNTHWFLRFVNRNILQTLVYIYIASGVSKCKYKFLYTTLQCAEWEIPAMSDNSKAG